jgi:hypothetical protein
MIQFVELQSEGFEIVDDLSNTSLKVDELMRLRKNSGIRKLRFWDRDKILSFSKA